MDDLIPMEDSSGGSIEPNSESVEEWLQEISEAEGLSREETLEDLISSYWRLEEIFHLLQDTDLDLKQTPRSTERGVASQNAIDEIRSRVDQLADEFEANESDAVTDAELQAAVAELENRIGDFERQVRTLSRDLSTVQDGPVAEFEELSERLASLEPRLDRLDSAVSEIDERMSSVAESAVSKEQFEAYTTQTGSLRESMWKEHQSLRDRVRTEFEHIRTILTYLVDSRSSDDGDLRETIRAIERDVQEHLREQESLASLAQAANREGFRTAVCANCDETVDIALLEDPSCPACEQQFESLESSPRYWGLSRRHVLTLADGSAEE